MSTACLSNPAAGFVDLATHDQLESYLYGGSDAYTLFVRQTRKCTWFTNIPIVLSKSSGTADFESEWSVNVSRVADYMLSAWLRVTTPEIKLNPATFYPDGQASTLRMRWTRNLMHNLIKDCSITFNDMVAQRFDNYHLDFWSAFTVPAGKRTIYSNMIGNFGDLTDPHKYTPVPPISGEIPSTYRYSTGIAPFTLNLHLPFWFSRDSGLALPTAALPYNDVRINICTRSIFELLIVDDISKVGKGENPSRCPRPEDFEACCVPHLSNVQVWANYAIVSNDERKRMACAPRDMLIEQVQTAPRACCLENVTNKCPRYDIRFSHGIKCLFFAVCNRTTKCEWSNYTAGSPVPYDSTVDFNAPAMSDAISTASIVYENTARLSNMGADYFSLVQPWYHAVSGPLETGYHMYSYALDMMSMDPQGSTNFGKLNNVSLCFELSSDAQASAAGAWPQSAGTNAVPGVTRANGGDFKQVFETVITAVNWNIGRVAGGAFGFPVL